jgi:hypothetical protein
MSRVFSEARVALAGLLAVCLGLLLGLCPRSGPPALAPARPEGRAYLFLSPNTDADLSLDEAVRRLSSPGQARFRRLAGAILSRVGAPGGEVLDAVGDWDDGAENSLLVVLPAGSDPVTLRYAAGWFGLLARQKAVLVFHPDPSGPDAALRLVLPGAPPAPGSLRRLLSQHGVRDRTLVSGGAGAQVVVFDPQRRLAPVLHLLAWHLGGRLEVTPGHGALLGAPTRERAGREFLALIRSYESLPGRQRFRPVASELEAATPLPSPPDAW